MAAQLTAAHAAQIAAEVTGSAVRSCRRFRTGLRHWVFDVEGEGGARVVVRLAHPDNRAELAGGVFWHDHLSAVGVPVPDLIAADAEAPQPYMVLQRLEGTDLGNVFDRLNNDDLDHVASAVAESQAKTAQLASTNGYGYALNYSTPLQETWVDVLRRSVTKSARRIDAAQVVDQRWSEIVRGQLDEAETSLDDVAPTAFLHDATTKNVIVHNGNMTGIVDTDEMAFGDPLWTVALTHTSLLAAKRSTHYVDLLVEAMGIANPKRMKLYTAIFALDFLSELGHKFNQDHTPTVSPSEIEHLTSILTDSLEHL